MNVYSELEQKENEIPLEEEIGNLERKLSELDRLTIADALLTLASNEVEQVVNSWIPNTTFLAEGFGDDEFSNLIWFEEYCMVAYIKGC